MVAVSPPLQRTTYVFDDGTPWWVVGAFYEPAAGTGDAWYQLEYAGDPDQALAQIQERLPGLLNPGGRPTPLRMTAWKFGPFSSFQEATWAGDAIRRGFSFLPWDHPTIRQLIETGVLIVGSRVPKKIGAAEAAAQEQVK